MAVCSRALEIGGVRSDNLSAWMVDIGRISGEVHSGHSHVILSSSSELSSHMAVDPLVSVICARRLSSVCGDVISGLGVNDDCRFAVKSRILDSECSDAPVSVGEGYGSSIGKVSHVVDVDGGRLS